MQVQLLLWLTAKSVQRGLEKGAFDFSYDGTPDFEKGFPTNKTEEKCTA